MIAKEFKRIMSILALLDDDTPVNINFGGYIMDDDHISSVQIVDDMNSMFVNIDICGSPYKDDCCAEEVNCDTRNPDYIVPYEPNAPMKNIEKSAIIDALEKCNHRKEDAARMLGISARTIYRKVKQYGL